MHWSVRRELESLLGAKPSAQVDAMPSHMSECEHCHSEVNAMRAQSEMLKTLRAPLLDPGAGFYARVLQRIEQSARRSIWWVFVYSPIGKRLAYASLALSIAFGSYVLTAEHNDGHWRSQSVTSRGVVLANHLHYDALVIGNAEQQRAAVLANFVSHPPSTGPMLEPATTLQ